MGCNNQGKPMQMHKSIYMGEHEQAVYLENLHGQLVIDPERYKQKDKCML